MIVSLLYPTTLCRSKSHRRTSGPRGANVEILKTAQEHGEPTATPSDSSGDGSENTSPDY